MTCTAAIRPFPNDTEIRCELDGDHPRHRGTVRDYAFPGSATEVTWADDDRRSFRGDWPGPCPEVDHTRPGLGACTLPAGHHGGHAA